MFELNAIVTEAIESGRRVIVANHNLHSIYLYHHDSKMRAFYAAADHIHVDGMAVVALARLLGIALRREHRVTFVDWMGPLASVAADHGWRVFYLGSRPGVAERGAEAFVAVIRDFKLKPRMGTSIRSPLRSKPGHSWRESKSGGHTFLLREWECRVRSTGL